MYECKHHEGICRLVSENASQALHCSLHGILGRCWFDLQHCQGCCSHIRPDNSQFNSVMTQHWSRALPAACTNRMPSM